jgi:hypothetical protein
MTEKLYHEKTIVERYATDYRMESEGLTTMPMEDILRAIHASTPEEKKALIKEMLESLEQAHLTLLSMAVQDGVITEEEIARWKADYQVGDSEIAQLVRPYYEGGLNINTEKKYPHTAYLVTTEGTGLWRLKTVAAERFNIGVITIEEMLRMERESR